jgi:hypothetical protein
MAGMLNRNVAEQDAVVRLGSDTSSLVLTLAYFSIFRHPLSEEELLSNAHFVPLPSSVGRNAIQDLLRQGILERSESFICLRGENALAGIRSDRSSRALLWQKHIEPAVQTMSQIPFLRGLLISGSLSKGTQDVDGDIDFLVLTTADRLWTARFFASLQLRLIPKYKRKHYCLNYWLPENHLFVSDRTLFSATEIAFLKPAMNTDLCNRFFEKNHWVKTFYPNWKPPEDLVAANKSSYRKRLLEWLLSGSLGDLFESRIRRWLMNRYKRTLRLHHSNHAGNTDARIELSEIKGHSEARSKGYKRKYYERLDSLESELGIHLTRWDWHLRPRKI